MKSGIAALAILVCASGMAADAKSAYTLYRTSAVTGGDKWRVHVATFDAESDLKYNRENCDTAKGLFQAQPGVSVSYWCERGYFSKK
jgi:hypothetical protein